MRLLPIVVLFALASLLAACAPSPGRVPRLAVSLPFGTVDTIPPPRGDGVVRVTGWVLSDDPIHIVALYIDGRYVTSALLHRPRPDVNRAYPAYGAVNPGWEIEFDGNLFRGDREVVIQARTTHDAVRELRSWRMRLPDSL